MNFSTATRHAGEFVLASQVLVLMNSSAFWTHVGLPSLQPPNPVDSVTFGPNSQNTVSTFDPVERYPGGQAK
jgi:hypothetical protein